MYTKSQWEYKRRYWAWQLSVEKCPKRRRNIKAVLEMIDDILEVLS